MKQFYSAFKFTICFLFLLVTNQSEAQNPTTVVNSTNCSVVQNFNTTTGGFTSPSIYAGQYDYEFDWTGAGSNGMLVSSSQAVAPYEASLISPVYPNTAPDGTANVGFTYTAPAGTYFRIRVLRPNNTTGVDIIALTSEGDPTNWRQLPGTSGTICFQLNDADLHPGQNYRYEFTFYTTSASPNITFDNFSLNSAAAAPLPVTFIGIAAYSVNNGVNIRWDVGDELNVQQYDVEKSTNGANFNTIGSVTAGKKMVYAYLDGSSKEPVVYYRVKSVDIDGKTNYSSIIKLVNGSSYSNTIKIYPMPVQSQLNVQHHLLGNNARITITTMDGRVIKSIIPGIGASNTMLDVSNLSSGMYLLRLDDNGKIQSTTFVKQ